MIEGLLVVGGFGLGVLVARWWTLVSAVGAGIWIGLVEEVEVPGVVMGMGYTLLSAAGIALGVLCGQGFRRGLHEKS